MGFGARPLPEWRYQFEGATIVRPIVCLKGRDAVIVRWQILGSGAEPMVLRVRPMLTVRPDHEVVSAANYTAVQKGARLAAQSWEGKIPA